MGIGKPEKHGYNKKEPAHIMRVGAGFGKRVKLKGERKMIITTTPQIEGKNIIEYRGIVFGEVVSGVDFVRDFAAGLSNIFGGRSNSYEDELMRAREQALAEMQQRAAAVGANAVVGVDIDYEVLGANNGMLMVTASGTAVVCQ